MVTLKSGWGSLGFEIFVFKDFLLPYQHSHGYQCGLGSNRRWCVLCYIWILSCLIIWLLEGWLCFYFFVFSEVRTDRMSEKMMYLPGSFSVIMLNANSIARSSVLKIEVVSGRHFWIVISSKMTARPNFLLFLVPLVYICL